jgi:hypothetical protein
VLSPALLPFVTDSFTDTLHALKPLGESQKTARIDPLKFVFEEFMKRRARAVFSHVDYSGMTRMLVIACPEPKG